MSDLRLCCNWFRIWPYCRFLYNSSTSFVMCHVSWLPGWGCRTVLVIWPECCSRVGDRQPSTWWSHQRLEPLFVNCVHPSIYIYLSRVMDMVMNTLAETAMWQMMSLHGPVTVLFSNSSAKSYLAVHQIKDKSTRKMSILQCKPFKVEKNSQVFKFV